MEFKAEQLKTEDFKREDFKHEDFKRQEFRREDFKTEDLKKDDFKTEGFRRDEFSHDEFKHEEFKHEEFKHEEFKHNVFKHEEFKHEEFNHEEFKREKFKTEALKTDKNSTQPIAKPRNLKEKVSSKPTILKPSVSKNAISKREIVGSSKCQKVLSKVRHLGQDEAIKIDEELFNEYKFSVDQLMELAGLSVASAIHRLYGRSHISRRVLVIAGPGNNGGDGMVAARHLKLFGFSDVVLLNARKPSKDLFINLVHQAQLSDVLVSYQADSFVNDTSVGLIVDALFGFSFKPPVRPDFQPLMNLLTAAGDKSIPIVSVDIPSGWDVEKGPQEINKDKSKSTYFMPDTLISLTAPKLCANFFKGPHHYLGGRFVPPKLAEKYSLNLPPYPGTECIAQLK